MDNNDGRWPVVIGTTESGEGRVFDYSKASNILVARAPKQEIKSLLPFFPTRMVLRVSDRKDSKLLLKFEGHSGS